MSTETTEKFLYTPLLEEAHDFNLVMERAQEAVARSGFVVAEPATWVVTTRIDPVPDFVIGDERRHVEVEVGVVPDPTLVSVTVAIGNSDDRLTQAEWSRFRRDTDVLIRTGVAAGGGEVHGAWVSPSTDSYQNAAWSISIPRRSMGELRRELGLVARKHRQESIAWTEGQTEFIAGLSRAEIDALENPPVEFPEQPSGILTVHVEGGDASSAWQECLAGLRKMRLGGVHA